ncbi:macrolide 2'-phosphotransferase [Agrococcus baldri]|uniref:Aminoglycoside phosphotransferase n=1 Tax=Agrococcus baldri TaxID=153730 RepID=A0AA87US29_9MICO|nr:macrolide 2'-phosphotransferase [Agrococcus baldri]GEK80010.1 aminoglycoside phosphotransferase [Agrococcus baldri]
MPDPTTAEGIVDLAARHGLRIEPESIRVDEAGLDFRVAFARARDGQDWVLRMPRRPDVSEAIEKEAAILATVRPHLSVSLPDWQVSAPDLIAYPLLPGRPGLTVDPSGEPVWHMDPQSPRYAAAFGALLAELHRIPVLEAAAGGLPAQSPQETRAEWRGQLDAVTAEFTVEASLERRWRTWIDDDGLWPTWSVCTHGELYPAHVLIDEHERPTAVLDWTTAKVSDPGRDFAAHHMVAGDESFALTVAEYERAGGRTWPRLAEHCAELAAAGAIGYGIYALTTGSAEHRDAAQQLLDPR